MAKRELFKKQFKLKDADPSLNSGPILQRCSIIATWFSGSLEINCQNFFSPKHAPELVIFTFFSSSDKDKVISHPEFQSNLSRENLKILPPPREADDSTIFVDNLPDSLFLFWDTEPPLTLADACEDFRTNLMISDPNIENIHLIQHKNGDTLSAPRAMQVSFLTPDLAQAFMNTDTRLDHCIIRKQNKSLNVHITPKYCSVCRKHDHHKGDPKFALKNQQTLANLLLLHYKHPLKTF